MYSRHVTSKTLPLRERPIAVHRRKLGRSLHRTAQDTWTPAARVTRSILSRRFSRTRLRDDTITTGTSQTTHMLRNSPVAGTTDDLDARTCCSVRHVRKYVSAMRITIIDTVTRRAHTRIYLRKNGLTP